MSQTAAERAREKAARLAPQRSTDDGRLAVPAEPVRAERVKPVRMTLDMAPSLHADLGDWAAAAARRTGQSRIIRADVLRVLVRQLLDDEALQQTVLDALKAGK